jgi:hypothetical protein
LNGSLQNNNGTKAIQLKNGGFFICLAKA